MSTYKVFVYGTLKRGQPNQYVMDSLECVRFLGNASTKDTYPLVISGQWNLPMLLNVTSQGKVEYTFFVNS